MRITTTKEELLTVLQQVSRLASKHITLPVLSCVLVSVLDGVVKIRATNLEAGIEYSLEKKGEGEGVYAIPASVFLNTIQVLPNGSTVTLEEVTGGIMVSGVGSVARLATQDASEFPTLPRVDEGVTVSVPLHELRAGIQAVSYCTSSSTIKPELSSVYVHVDGSALICTATDSFRLAEKKIPLKQSTSVDPFLVPGRTTQEFLKALENAPADSTLTLNQHQLALTSETTYFTMRLTSGTFPDYTKIIPTTIATEATLLRYDLEQALRKSGVFVSKSNQVVIEVQEKSKQLTVHAESEDVGEITDTLQAVIEGGALSVKFNQQYLLESLGPIGSDSVTLQFAGEGQPLVVRGVNDPTFLYLVMPMNR